MREHNMTVIDPPDLEELGSFTEQGIFEELQDLEVKMDDFEKGDSIGRGTSGEVYKATQKSTGRTVVIKKLFNCTETNDKGLKRELYALASLRHPRVVEMVGVVFTEGRLSHIVMELMEKGSIVIYDGKSLRRLQLDPTQKTKIIFDMATGLEFLHSKQFIHRDVKPANVLLDGNFRAKIGDLGSSRQVDEVNLQATQTQAGTPIYWAPEALDKHFTTKSDIYSFGIMIFELFSLFKTQMQKVKEIKALRNESKLPSEFEEKYPQIARLVKKMTEPRGKKRPSAFEILHSSLFEKK